jgi:hypothetical protein
VAPTSLKYFIWPVFNARACCGASRDRRCTKFQGCPRRGAGGEPKTRKRPSAPLSALSWMCVVTPGPGLGLCFRGLAATATGNRRGRQAAGAHPPRPPAKPAGSWKGAGPGVNGRRKRAGESLRAQPAPACPPPRARGHLSS